MPKTRLSAMLGCLLLAIPALLLPAAGAALAEDYVPGEILPSIPFYR